MRCHACDGRTDTRTVESSAVFSLNWIRKKFHIYLGWVYWGALIKWDVWWTVSVTGKITFVGSGLLRQNRKETQLWKVGVKQLELESLFLQSKYCLRMFCLQIPWQKIDRSPFGIFFQVGVDSQYWHSVSTPTQMIFALVGVNTHCRHWLLTPTKRDTASVGVNTYQRRYRFVRCQHHVIVRRWHSVSTPT